MTIVRARPISIVVENLYVESFHNVERYKEFISENRKIQIINVIKFEGKLVVTFIRKEREYYD